MSNISTQQAILMALRADVGTYAYKVAEKSGFSRKVISRKLSGMALEGKIRRESDGNGAYLYYLKSDSPPIFAKPARSTLDTQTIAALWHRVAMLRRMRERTIADYHPLLDAVIKDYETFLRREEDGGW